MSWEDQAANECKVVAWGNLHRTGDVSISFYYSKKWGVGSKDSAAGLAIMIVTVETVSDDDILGIMDYGRRVVA